MGLAHFRAVSAPFTLALAFVGLTAAAHEIGTTQVHALFQRDGTYRIDLTTAPLPLLARLERAAGFPRSSGLAGDAAVQRVRALTDTFVQQIEIRFDGTLVHPNVDVTRVSSGVKVQLRGEVPSGARTFTWRNRLVSASYPIAFENEGETPVRHWIEADAASKPFPLRAHSPMSSRLAIARQYLALGFLHILPRGLDHILFVVGIFLITARVRPVVAQVTAFTIAHSITLGLTMYGVLSMSARFVEPLIALSIVYVAVENLAASRVTPWRVAVVFLFGLLHGMGFAGVLREIGLPGGEVPVALLAFNTGVETGQLTVIALAALLLASWNSRKEWYRRRVVVPISVVIAATGLFWTIQRILSA